MIFRHAKLSLRKTFDFLPLYLAYSFHVPGIDMSSMVIKVIEALGPAMKTGIDSAYSKPCPVPGGAKTAEA